MSATKTLRLIKACPGKKFSCVYNNVYVEGYIEKIDDKGYVLLFNPPPNVMTEDSLGWRRTEYGSFPLSNGIHPDMKYGWYVSIEYDLRDIKYFHIINNK